MKARYGKYSVIFILFIIGVLGIFNAEAESLNENNTEYKNIEQMLVAIHWEKKQIESMIDKMISSGRISSDEGKEAKNSMANIQEKDLEKLKIKLIAEVKAKENLEH